VSEQSLSRCQTMEFWGKTISNLLAFRSMDPFSTCVILVLEFCILKITEILTFNWCFRHFAVCYAQVLRSKVASPLGLKVVMASSSIFRRFWTGFPVNFVWHFYIFSCSSLFFSWQACLGEAKKDKGNESVCLFVNFDDQKLVLGTLSHEKIPQIPFDLVFEKDFELSHNLKNGSVFFSGYKVAQPEYPFTQIYVS